MPLYLPVRHTHGTFPNGFLDKFQGEYNAFEFDQSLKQLEESHEYLHILDDCDLRLSEISVKGNSLRVVARLSPDAQPVVSWDQGGRQMELSLKTSTGPPVRAMGAVIGWARRRLHVRDAVTVTFTGGDDPGLPVELGETRFDEEMAQARGDPMDQISEDYPQDADDAAASQSLFAIVDLGRVSLADYIGVTSSKLQELDEARFEGGGMDFFKTYVDNTGAIEYRSYVPERFAGRKLFALPGREFQEFMRDEREKEATEGVRHRDNALSDFQRDRLNAAIEQLLDDSRLDGASQEHPSPLRYVVDAALYPFVSGESRFEESEDLSDPSRSPQLVPDAPRSMGNHRLEKDMWGSPFEDSVYQVLPTYFAISRRGKVEVEDYLNGVPKVSHAALYTALEHLFELCMPLLEHAWTFGTVVDLAEGPEGLSGLQYHIPRNFGMLRLLRGKRVEVVAQRSLRLLRGKRVQVVTQIRDYDLAPEEEYEEDWHVDGMPRENIIAAGLYVAARDAELEGGRIQFKRNLQDMEEMDFLRAMDAPPPEFLQAYSEDGLIPAGQLDTRQNRLMVGRKMLFV
eukprot:scaffold5017_cov200-Pinguiococcus_pyrenoidosus.AAC.4